MRILVIGSGGREHALAWKIAQSPLVKKVYCAPGNAGIAKTAECVPLSVMDLEGLAAFAEKQGIDLTVVGPEAPLIAGIVDKFEARGLAVFGPSTDPARIEGSKSFAKKIMQTSGIPTAEFWVCDSLSVARARVTDYYAARGADAKVVVKADGLAAGKGVTVASSEQEALATLDLMMQDRMFGAAGDRVVIEECLVGEEASIMAITDGEHIVPLLPSQDHKRIDDGDQGPNTGGMGAYSPVPVIPADTVDLAVELILAPAVRAIRELGIPYRGVLYAGVIVTETGLKTIEFNCRFGDPETQVVLPMLESDLVPLLIGATDCTLEHAEVTFRQGAAVCVVASSRGYPESHENDQAISGLAEADSSPNCLVFHAGTRIREGGVATAGGRILGVTGLGANLREAAVNAYAGMSHIQFDGMHYRTDIGARALKA